MHSKELQIWHRMAIVGTKDVRVHFAACKCLQIMANLLCLGQEDEVVTGTTSKLQQPFYFKRVDVHGRPGNTIFFFFFFSFFLLFFVNKGAVTQRRNPSAATPERSHCILFLRL